MKCILCQEDDPDIKPGCYCKKCRKERSRIFLAPRYFGINTTKIKDY